MGTVFQTFWKNLIFSKICDIYDFGWLLSALQFKKCPKGLYKMNTNPWRVSLSITKGSGHKVYCMAIVVCCVASPILLFKAQNFNGELVFEDQFFCGKVFD